MRFVVTGANGCVGSHVVDALLGAGHRVDAWVREGADVSNLAGTRAEVVHADYRDVEGMKRLLRGVDAVAHVAGGGLARSKEALFDMNAGMTKRLLEACEVTLVGPRKFVFMSTVAAFGFRKGSAEEPPAPVSDYGEAKREAELSVLTMKHALDVSILRPPMVYGMRDTRLLPLAKAVKRGWHMHPVSGDRLYSLIHATDLAQAVTATFAWGLPSGTVWFPTDGEDHTQRDLAQSMMDGFEALGDSLKRRELTLGKGVLRIAAHINRATAKLRGTTPALHPGKLGDLLETDARCPPCLIAARIDWEPEKTLTQGMEETIAWYRDQGWV